jgi:flagellar M-ring protein FliF
MEQLRQLFERALELVRVFRTANPQIFNLIAAALALTAAISSALYVLNPGAPVLVATNLAPADRTALAMRLRHYHIDFTVGPDSITVPSGQAAEARRLMATSPSFAGGIDGFPLFDQSTLGQSDFAEQVNYQRAQQGELERTLMDIHGVDSARVMLAMGRPSPFALGPGEAARASVMLTTAPGAMIDPATARAIAHLVAGSVRGLAVENVVITGNDGVLLYPPQHEGEYGEATRLRDDLEHRLQEKISLLLNRIMGENRFAAEVSVAIDTSRVTSHDRLFGKGDQAVVSEEHTVTPAGMQAGGIPGLTSNLPVASPSATPATAPAQAANRSSAATPARPGAAVQSAEKQSVDAEAARKDIVNYKPSSHETSTVTAPVRVQRITVAVVLDGTYEGGHFKPMPEERLNAIRGLLAAAIGAEADRGDSVDVQSAPLSQPYVPPVPDPMTQLRAYFSNPIHLYEAAGAALLVLVLLGWLLKRTISRLFGRKRADRLAVSAPPAAPDTISPAESPQPELTLDEVTPPEPARSEYEELRIRLNEQVDRDPQAAAAILRKWLESSNGHVAESNGHLLQ